MSFPEKPNVNTVPYIQPLDTPLAPERFVRILGAVLPFGRVFSCNLQCGSNQFDDVGLQISAELIENTIVINSQQHGSWNEEQTFLNFKVNRGQFEILIICEFTIFKIKINGNHLCDFPHRIPYQQLKYVKIEGDVNVSSITVESQPTAPTVMMNNLPPPPYSEPAPQPMGYYPPPFNSGQQMSMPMPMPMPISTPNYSNVVPPQSQQQPYVSDPLIQQQARIAALNATPRPYQGRWNGFFRYGDRKVGIIGLVIYGVVAVIFIVVFLIVFFTMFNKANSEHEAFRKKHFPDW